MAQTEYGQLQRDDSNYPIGWDYVNISTIATLQTIKASPGVLHTVNFNKPVATSVVTIYDSILAQTGTIGQITIPATPQNYIFEYDVAFNKGLLIKIATAASDLTVTYI